MGGDSPIAWRTMWFWTSSRPPGNSSARISAHGSASRLGCGASPTIEHVRTARSRPRCRRCCDQLFRGEREHVVPGARRSPHHVVGHQVRVDEHSQLGVVAERRHPADGEPGRRPHRVGVDAAAHRATCGDGQLRLVELVRPADVGEHDLAVDREDQALHDLADITADRRCCVDCGLGPLGEANRLARRARSPHRLRSPGSRCGAVRQSSATTVAASPGRRNSTVLTIPTKR